MTAPRALAPDLARGAMLLLIAMAYATVHAGGGFGTPGPPGEAPVDTAARVLSALLLDNRAFPMFAILFGYGLTMMVGRRRAAGMPDDEVRALVRRRSLWLLAFGFVHAVLVFPGEILGAYGLAGLLLGGLLLRPDRTVHRVIAWLVPLTAVLALGAQIGLHSAGDAARTVGYLTVEDWVARATAGLATPLLNAVYPLLLAVAIGIAAGRRGLIEDPARHRALLRRVAVVGIAVSVLGAAPAALMAAGVLAPDLVAGGALLALQVVTGVAGGAGYAAGFALLTLRGGRGRFAQAVAAMGRRSLTFYLADSVLVAVLLHPDLVGLPVGAAGALAVAAAVWLAMVPVAAWMERTGRPGPADRLLRRLSGGGLSSRPLR